MERLRAERIGSEHRLFSGWGAHPAERWFHIVENHDDLAGHYDDVLDVVENPDLILRGYGSSLIAMHGAGRGMYLAVVYRQLSADDGFIITAYFTSKVERRKAIWKAN